jgi:hypothetical protein
MGHLRPLGAGAGKRASVAGLDEYLRRDQIRFLDYSEWYTVGGAFDADRVLRAWVDALQGAQARGFDGLRLTGNTFWLEQSAWRDFTQYEAAVDSGDRLRYAMCYSRQVRAAEIMDVMKQPRVRLIKRGEHWQVIGAPNARRSRRRCTGGNDNDRCSTDDGRVRAADRL